MVRIKAWGLRYSEHGSGAINEMQQSPIVRKLPITTNTVLTR